MKIETSVAVVTGANRGLGRHFAEELLRRGADKVYAAARRPETVDVPGVEPLVLDVTDPASVAAAARAASDVTLLVNNAGVSTFARLTDGEMDDVELEMNTNYYGTLRMVRAFAPHLARAGGGGILNVLSVMSLMSYEHSNSYSASKAAQWALTNGVRLELAPQHTQVTGLIVGSIDTDMMASMDVPKNRPEDVVRTALDGFEAGRLEVLADEFSVQWKARLAEDPSTLYPQLAG